MTRRLMLGVIGHVDHGKTALVRALTGIETDRLPEEKQRGISIALGFAHLQVGEDQIDIIDMPGHERFVRTMVSGATGIDAVLLVVAANEGVMPQTVEHVDIAVLLGIERAILVLTKIDLVSPTVADAASDALSAFARKAGLRAETPIRSSATASLGLDAVRTAMAAVIGTTRPQAGFAYLPVDRAFSIAGHGTVVTGTLRRGPLSADTEIELAPSGRRARIRSLQVHGQTVPHADPGQRVAVNLRGLDLTDVPRGIALCTPGLLDPADWLSVRLTAVADTAPLRTGSRLTLLIGTDEVDARLRLLDRDVLEPGDIALAQLHCARPVSVPSRERFILRIASPAATVAGGLVLDPSTRRARRHAPRTLERLSSLADADGADLVIEAVLGAGGAGLSVRQAAQLAGVSPERATASLATPDITLIRGDIAVARTVLDTLVVALPRLLAAREALEPAGLSRERLAELIPSAGPVVLDEAIARSVAAGTLRRQGGSLNVARPARERAEALRQAQAGERLAESIRQGGLAPPDIPDDRAHKLTADRLVRSGVLVRTHDRVLKRDVLFHREAIEDACRTLMPLLHQGGVLVKDVGLALAISRKFSVPLLEYLDSVRFTRRVGDRRVAGDAGSPPGHP